MTSPADVAWESGLRGGTNKAVDGSGRRRTLSPHADAANSMKLIRKLVHRAQYTNKQHIHARPSLVASHRDASPAAVSMIAGSTSPADRRASSYVSVSLSPPSPERSRPALSKRPIDEDLKKMPRVKYEDGRVGRRVSAERSRHRSPGRQRVAAEDHYHHHHHHHHQHYDEQRFESPFAEGDTYYPSSRDGSAYRRRTDSSSRHNSAMRGGGGRRGARDSRSPPRWTSPDQVRVCEPCEDRAEQQYLEEEYGRDISPYLGRGGPRPNSYATAAQELKKRLASPGRTGRSGAGSMRSSVTGGDVARSRVDARPPAYEFEPHVAPPEEQQGLTEQDVNAYKVIFDKFNGRGALSSEGHEQQSTAAEGICMANLPEVMRDCGVPQATIHNTNAVDSLWYDLIRTTALVRAADESFKGDYEEAEQVYFEADDDLFEDVGTPVYPCVEGFVRVMHRTGAKPIVINMAELQQQHRKKAAPGQRQFSAAVATTTPASQRVVSNNVSSADGDEFLDEEDVPEYPEADVQDDEEEGELSGWVVSHQDEQRAMARSRAMAPTTSSRTRVSAKKTSPSPLRSTRKKSTKSAKSPHNKNAAKKPTNTSVTTSEAVMAQHVLTERLYKTSIGKHRSVHATQLQEEERQKCTFKPKINSISLFAKAMKRRNSQRQGAMGDGDENSDEGHHHVPGEEAGGELPPSGSTDTSLVVASTRGRTRHNARTGTAVEGKRRYEQRTYSSERHYVPEDQQGAHAKKLKDDEPTEEHTFEPFKAKNERRSQSPAPLPSDYVPTDFMSSVKRLRDNSHSIRMRGQSTFHGSLRTSEDEIKRLEESSASLAEKPVLQLSPSRRHSDLIDVHLDLSTSAAVPPHTPSALPSSSRPTSRQNSILSITSASGILQHPVIGDDIGDASFRTHRSSVSMSQSPDGGSARRRRASVSPMVVNSLRPNMTVNQDTLTTNYSPRRTGSNAAEMPRKGSNATGCSSMAAGANDAVNSNLESPDRKAAQLITIDAASRRSSVAMDNSFNRSFRTANGSMVHADPNAVSLLSAPAAPCGVVAGELSPIRPIHSSSPVSRKVSVSSLSRTIPARQAPSPPRADSISSWDVPSPPAKKAEERQKALVHKTLVESNGVGGGYVGRNILRQQHQHQQH